MPRIKKRPLLSAARAEKAQQRRKILQIVGIAVVVVLIVAGLVAIIIGRQSMSQSATTVPTKSVTAASSTQAAGTVATPALVGTKQYASAPPMLIDKTKPYTATVKMAKGGEFVIQLYADKAPLTVNSFVFLARQGYFNGVTFHRVLDGFMAQGGDPTGTGGGGPGYQFANEDSDLTFDKAGVVAMANAGRDTNGSQFFITFGPQPSLNGGYTIFGQVISGMDMLRAITPRDPSQNANLPPGDKILSITIEEK